MNEQAKAWIDYIVDDLMNRVGPLDSDKCVQHPDFDKAMNSSTINQLADLRELIDGPAPVGYPKAEHAYMHDADLQRLRSLCRQGIILSQSH